MFATFAMRYHGDDEGCEERESSEVQPPWAAMVGNVRSMTYIFRERDIHLHKKVPCTQRFAGGILVECFGEGVAGERREGYSETGSLN